MSPIGVLLLQLGTPDSPSTRDVRRFLREFLSDPRVLDMPAPARALLLYGVILPFRPRRSAHQYQQIWTEAGSPLRIHTDALAGAVAASLGAGYRVEVGMRYRQPSIADAVESLVDQGCERLVVVPLYPQYASSAGGSALAEALRVAAGRWNVVDVATVPPFFGDAGYHRALVEVSKRHLSDFGPDFVLFSYHGLPESQARKSHLHGTDCVQSKCTDTLGEDNRFCYVAQCYATTRGVAAVLGLEPGRHTTTFQSRLKGQRWLSPYTDVEVVRLHEQGVRRLAVITPSFTADCLETLEEIGIRLRRQWEGLGGEDLLLVPCLNADPAWVDALVALVRRAAGSADEA